MHSRQLLEFLFTPENTDNVWIDIENTKDDTLDTIFSNFNVNSTIGIIRTKSSHACVIKSINKEKNTITVYDPLTALENEYDQKKISQNFADIMITFIDRQQIFENILAR